MEEIVLFEDNGNTKFCYKRDGSTSSSDYTSLFSASTALLESSHVNSYIISSPSNKKIAGKETYDNGVICYITDQQYPDIALQRILDTQVLMYKAFDGSFLRSIHVDGAHLQTIFQRPRVHPHVERKDISKLFAALTSACSTTLLAIYCQGIIMEATDEYWVQDSEDIYAIDVLVRNSEAPFTDQPFRKANNQYSHACVIQLQNSLKLVAVGNVNLPQIMVSKLPSVFAENQKYLISLMPEEKLKLNLKGWIIKDRETPRYFGDIPPALEGDFIQLVCKTEEIVEKNRVTSVALTLNGYKFFYLPRVLVNQKSILLGNRLSHVWDFYFIYDDAPTGKAKESQDNIQALFDFGIRTMQELVPYLRAVERNKDRQC